MDAGGSHCFGSTTFTHVHGVVFTRNTHTKVQSVCVTLWFHSIMTSISGFGEASGANTHFRKL